MDIVTMGETMVLFSPDTVGSLKYVHSFKKQVAGAESNFAIGVTRLGLSCGWISKLGEDPFGDYIKSFVAGEGVDVSRIIRTDKNQTGVFFKEFYSQGDPRVYYYRRDSAFSTITPEELPEEYIKSAKLLHITGITPALSDSASKAVFRAIEIAKSSGVKISFDPNVRKKLWTKEESAPVLLEIMKLADIALPGLSELRYIFGDDDMSPETACERVLQLGASVVALKMGKKGCIAGDRNGFEYVMPTRVIENVVDSVGTGDGFNAGFIYGYMKGMSIAESAKLGCDVGAYVATVIGDVEGLPTLKEIELFRNNEKAVTR